MIKTLNWFRRLKTHSFRMSKLTKLNWLDISFVYIFWQITVFRLFTTGVATNQTALSQKDIQYISTSFMSCVGVIFTNNIFYLSKRSEATGLINSHLDFSVLNSIMYVFEGIFFFKSPYTFHICSVWTTRG